VQRTARPTNAAEVFGKGQADVVALLGLTFAPYNGHPRVDRLLPWHAGASAKAAEDDAKKSRRRRKYISAENLGDCSQRVEDNAFHLCDDEPPLRILGERTKVRGIFFA